MALLESLIEALSPYHSSHTCWVAYSGGVDSQVLLHLCALVDKQHTFPHTKFKAIHVNHGLSDNADLWQEHCEKHAKAFGIPLSIVSLNVSCPKGESVEAHARTLRYLALAKQIAPGDIVLCAHHLNDQAETLLLQCLRGAGPKGLASMPANTSFHDGLLLRPLLAHTKTEIETYAKKNQLEWVVDDSNQDSLIRRNYLRHQVLPLLELHWPGVYKTLARTSEHCAEANALLDRYAKQLMQTCGQQDNTLSVSGLLSLDEQQQRLVLRHFIAQQNKPLPNQARLLAIQKELLLAAHDAQPCVRWQGVEIRRYQDTLFIMSSLPEHDVSLCLEWDGASKVYLAAIDDYLSPNDLTPEVIDKLLGAQHITIRFRQGGEQIVRGAGQPSQSLKNYFQEQQVSPWLRDRTPLLFVDDELIEVIKKRR